MSHTPFDCNANPIIAGDTVKVIKIPPRLPAGLTQEDQAAIKAQLGKILIVQDFDQDGHAELEFIDDAGHIHTIWIEPYCLEKQTPGRDSGLDHA